MRLRFVPVVMIVAALGLAACSAPAPSQEFGKADVDQIKAMVQDFVTAYNARDLEKVGSFFSASAALMPANRSTLRGVDTVKGYYEGPLEGRRDHEPVDRARDGGRPWSTRLLRGHVQPRTEGTRRRGDRPRSRQGHLDRPQVRRWVEVRLADDEQRPAAGRSRARTRRQAGSEIACRSRHSIGTAFDSRRRGN